MAVHERGKEGAAVVRKKGVHHADILHGRTIGGVHAFPLAYERGNRLVHGMDFSKAPI